MSGRIGETFVLVLVASALGWIYGFVACVGYSRDLPRHDPIRAAISRKALLIGCGLSLFLRHLATGDFVEWLFLFHRSVINDMGAAVLLFGIPFTLLIMFVFLMSVLGCIVFAGYALVTALYYLPGFLIGVPITFYFTFVRHPAAPEIVSALREGSAIDVRRAANGLMPRMSELDTPPSVIRSKFRMHRARALKEQLEAYAEVAEAIERRERARAAMMRAEATVQDTKARIKGKRR